MKCSKCGKEVSEGKFCPECGTKFLEENEEGRDVKADRKPKKKIFKYLGIGALVYIVATVIVGILTGGVDDSETRAETYIEEVKEENTTEIQEEVSEQSSEKENDSVISLTYDLNTDIENSMLHSDGSGHIVDDYGNIIPEYSYIEITENGSLYDVESDCIMEGYEVSPNGQISRYMVMDDYSETSAGNSLTEIIGLRSGEYKNPKSPVVITIPDEVYSTESTEIFVYVPIYIGTEDNKYEYEYSGMINLFDIGTITIMTGPQSSTWLKYDYEEGYISEATSLIYDSLGADYEIDGVTKFYIDGFAPDTVNFVGEVGTYFCEDVNGYAGRVYVNQITEESIEFDVSSLSWADNEYFVQGGYGKITDNNTAVYKGITSSITLQWDENGNIQLLVEGDLPYGSVKEQEAIESVIGQTFEFVSPEYVGW